MPFHNSDTPAARAWRWLHHHGWVFDSDLASRKPSVFEALSPKRSLTYVACMALIAWPLFLVMDADARGLIWSVAAGSFFWCATFAVVGRGKVEHIPGHVTLALVLATAMALIGPRVLWAAARSAMDLPEEPLRDADALPYFIFAGVYGIQVTAREYAIDQKRIAEGRELRERARAEREADARLLAEARLGALTAQIEPHFVFNALAHLQALIAESPATAQRMTEALTRYLRQALAATRSLESTLGEELDRARAYLDVMKIRMGDRLSYTIDTEPSLGGVRFPPLVLATLIENAIKHGLEPAPRGGRVEISATRAADRLLLRVRDDGIGLGKAGTSGHGVGLANTRDRLVSLYGEAAALVVEPNVPAGCAVTVTIPMDEHDADRADR